MGPTSLPASPLSADTAVGPLHPSRILSVCCISFLFTCHALPAFLPYTSRYRLKAPPRPSLSTSLPSHSSLMSTPNTIQRSLQYITATNTIISRPPAIQNPETATANAISPYLWPACLRFHPPRTFRSPGRLGARSRSGDVLALNAHYGGLLRHHRNPALRSRYVPAPPSSTSTVYPLPCTTIISCLPFMRCRAGALPFLPACSQTVPIFFFFYLLWWSLSRDAPPSYLRYLSLALGCTAQTALSLLRWLSGPGACGSAAHMPLLSILVVI